MKRKTKKKPMQKRAKARSALELEFEAQLKERQITGWVTELAFAMPDRKWRLDFAWPGLKIGVEIQGGTWRGGRHTRGAGFESDTEKRLYALKNGWRVLEFTSRMVKSGVAINTTESFLRFVINENTPPWH